MNEKNQAIVQKSGVIYLNNGTSAEIRVNGEDLITQIYNQVFGEIGPKTDWNSNFAGSVTIIVDVFGDIEED